MSADFLHGDMGKEERSNVLRRFRAGQLRTLVVSGASYLRAVSSNTTGVSLHGFCVCVCVCVCARAKNGQLRTLVVIGVSQFHAVSVQRIRSFSQVVWPGCDTHTDREGPNLAGCRPQ